MGMAEDEDSSYREGAMTDRVRDLMIRDLNRAESNDDLPTHRHSS